MGHCGDPGGRLGEMLVRRDAKMDRLELCYESDLT
jgi:hypothetical protein